jgi:hypothetical protein
MLDEIKEDPVIPMGFGRSLLWAFGVTAISAVVVVTLPSWHRASFLPACLLGAAILYPVALGAGLRHAARCAFVTVLLLVPTIEATHRPWVCLLAAAVVIGLLRSWFCRAKGCQRHLRREASSILASVALGAYLLDDSALGLSFGVWGFCLGQVVATLFVDSRDRWTEWGVE